MVPFLRTFGYDIRTSIGTAAAVGFLIALTGTTTMIIGGNIINNVNPNEIYNFADQDHVGWSYQIPSYSFKATALSGGEGRRVEIARCLINNPSVLLLDEPFAGVDLLALQDIKGLLLKLQRRGTRLIITDHNASQLLSVVDRAYVIANGVIVANGTPRQIVNTNEAKKLYFGEDFTI